MTASAAAPRPETPDPVTRDELAFLVDAGILLAAAEDEGDALTRLADLIVPRVADGCVFDLVADDGRVVRALVHQIDPARAEAVRIIAERYPVDPAAEANVVARVLRSGQPILSPDVPDAFLAATARDEDHLRLLRSLGIRSSLIVPLTVRGETLGAVTLLAIESGRRYGPADLALAEALARQTAIAIDGARRRTTVEEARRTAERALARTAHLQAATAALGRAITPQDVAEVIVGEGVAALGARAGAVMLLDGDGDHLTPAAIAGYSPAAAAAFRRIPLDSPLPAAVAVRTHEAVWISSRLAHAAGQPALTWEPTAEGDYAVAGVPMELDGRVIGAIGLSFPVVRAFAAEDRAFGLALARQCAQALERARLYVAEREARQSAEQDRRRVAFLADASAALAGSLDWEETLTQVLDLVVPALADWCAVDVETESGELRRFAVRSANPDQHNLAAELQSWPPVPGRSLGAASIYASGRSQLYPDVDERFLREVAWDEAHLERLRQTGFRSYVGAPLMARDRTVGVIGLFAAESGRRFGPDDRVLVEELARRAALAVDNARLFREQVAARTRVQELAAERTRVLGQIADGVLIADATGSITFANNAAQTLHGEPALALPLDVATYAQTYRIRTAAGAPLSPEEFPLRRALDAGETIVNATWRLRRRSGDDLVVAGSAAPILADDGTLLGAVQTFQDVTERRAFEQERDAFVATVTHDLKTPLTSVKGWAQLLLARAGREPDRARDVAALGAIVEQAEAMQRLLDQLLATASGAFGEREPRLQPRPVDLVEHTTWLVAIHQGMTDRHHLQVGGAAPGEVVGCCDPDALRQILGNLISNAVKYSPAGGPVVVTVARDGGEARLAVRDQGIGIPADALPRVFSQFFRAENAVRATADAPVDSQGLGLYSAQALAARLGGRIEVESIEGAGSIFTLILPLDECDERHGS